MAAAQETPNQDHVPGHLRVPGRPGYVGSPRRAADLNSFQASFTCQRNKLLFHVATILDFHPKSEEPVFLALE